MNKKNIKCVDVHIVYDADDDNPYGKNTTVVTYDDNSTELIRSFSSPQEVELFCGKAYADITETRSGGALIVEYHYDGKHPYFN